MIALEKMANKAGVTPQAYLEAMFAEHVKPSVVAMVMGLTVATVYKYVRKYKLKIEKTKAKVWVNGVKDTLQNHCAANNVAYLSVRVRMSRYRMTPEQAISDQVENDKKYKRGAFNVPKKT